MYFGVMWLKLTYEYDDGLGWALWTVHTNMSVSSVIKVRRRHRRFACFVMGLLQLRYEHDSSTIRLRFERDTTSYEELCAFEQ